MRHILSASVMTLALFVFSSTSFADVVLTFDSDTEGFALDAGVGTVTHAVVGGEGMLRLQSDGGWEGQLSKLDNSDPVWGSALTAEINDALTNGGTVSFDVTVLEADQTYAAAPGWFEVVLIGQGEVSGWDQEVVGIGLGAAQWPLASGSYSTNVSLGIVGGAATDDDDTQFDATDTWRNFYIGLNNDGANMSNAVVYIDNFTVSASAVPEPASMAILGLLGMVAVNTRRRK